MRVCRIKSTDLNHELEQFIVKSCKELKRIYGKTYDLSHFPFEELMDNHYFAICYGKTGPVGMMIGRLKTNIFDANVIFLTQITLYAVPGTKAAYYLMNDFIDFGKNNANYIISTINTQTNIKGRSLERLGFKETERVFRLEVK